MTDPFSGWGELIAAFVAFFASHRLPARPPIRQRLVAALGSPVYMAAYSALSVAVLAWLIVAAGRAPYVEIWSFAPWQLWLPNIAMPIALCLIVFGAAAPNPFSIASKNADGFDPDHPGIAGITRHPLIGGLSLWALAHLIPNGDLAHLILFGLFGAFGLLGMAAIDKRRKREWGEEVWSRRARHTAFVPFAGLVTGKTRLRGFHQPLRRTLIAITVYFALLLLHPALIGVSPLPA